MNSIAKIPFLALISLMIWSCQSDIEPDDNPVIDDNVEVQTEKQTIVVDTVLTDLGNPWSMAFMPSGELLIAIRSGKLLLYQENSKSIEEIQGLPNIYVKGQGGLLDLELHPEYPSNGWIYFSYSSPGDNGGNTALMRAKLNGYQLVNKEKLYQGLPYTSSGVHFGSRIGFDSDGKLFLTIGDRGSPANAQNLNNSNGKILRFNDDGTIPPDNPFSGESNILPEIFSYGHRNPQGMAIHPTSGDIWTHEHGPQGGDEINSIKRKRNYGWPEITYGINYNGSIISEFTAKDGMEQPLHYWVPSIAPCGMKFITGDLYPSWKGDLFVGSLKFRYLNRIVLDGEKVILEEKLLEEMGRMRAIEQGPTGLIYVAMESPGMIVRLLPVE
jgi:glucose/arabinose dehydrogenase